MNSRWERDGRVNPVGLYDLQRQISLLPHGEMFDLTDRPASLKVEV